MTPMQRRLADSQGLYFWQTGEPTNDQRINQRAVN